MSTKTVGPVTLTAVVGFLVLLVGLATGGDAISVVTLIVGLALLVSAALMAVLNGSLR